MSGDRNDWPGVQDDIACWFDAKADDARELLTVSAIGGSTVRVEQGVFERLAEAAGGDITPDFSRAALGRLIDAAKRTAQAAALESLLTVRSETAPVYRVRTTDGKPWRPAVKPVVAKADASVGDEVAAYLGGD